MKDQIMCPICHHQANHEIYSCEWGIEEEYTDCYVCGFREEFAYGYHSVMVGNKWFAWNYTLVGNRYTNLMKKISRAEFMARRNWKKFRKRTCVKDCPVMR